MLLECATTALHSRNSNERPLFILNILFKTLQEFFIRQKFGSNFHLSVFQIFSTFLLEIFEFAF